MCAWCAGRPEEGIRHPGTRVNTLLWAARWCWKSNLVLLTSVTSKPSQHIPFPRGLYNIVEGLVCLPLRQCLTVYPRIQYTGTLLDVSFVCSSSWTWTCCKLLCLLRAVALDNLSTYWLVSVSRSRVFLFYILCLLLKCYMAAAKSILTLGSWVLVCPLVQWFLTCVS